MAPAADMFEMGVKVQVLKRGTMFAMRAPKLYELYRTYPSWEAIPAAERVQVEKNALPRAVRRGLGRRPATFFAAPRPDAAAEGRDATRSTRWPWCSAGTWACRRAGPTPASRRGSSTTRCGAARRWARSTSGRRARSWSSRRTARWSAVALNLLYGACVVLAPAGAAAAGRRTCRTSASRRRRWTADELERDWADEARRRRTRAVEDDRVEHRTRPTSRRWPSSASAACSRRRPGRASTGRTSRTASTASPRCRRRTGTRTTTSTPTRRRPDMTYARRGGFLDAGRLQPARVRHRRPATSRRPTPTQLLGLVAAQQALRGRGVLRRPRRPKSVDRDRVTVILGVTGTLELVDPARRPARPPAAGGGRMKDAGVADDAGRRRRRPHRRRLRRLAGELASPACSATSSPAGSPTGSTWAAPTASSTPPAPARCRAVHLAGAGTADRPGRRRRHRRRATRSTTSSCTCASARRRPCRRRATRSRSTPTATAPSSARGWASSC